MTLNSKDYDLNLCGNVETKKVVNLDNLFG